MKLELPDNNASVLFHMGNALQSIARDIDTSLPVNGHKVTSTETVGDVSHSVTVEQLVKLSESIDKMIESVAADWKVPVNRLTGNTTDAKQDGKSVLGDCLDSIDDLAESFEYERAETIYPDNSKDIAVVTEASDTIDADGLPWDQRIHSRGKTRLADNTWRMARKPNDKTDEEWAEYVEGIKTELKALMAIPVTVTYDPNEADPFAIEPPVVDTVVIPPVVDAAVMPPIVIEAPEVVTPPVVDAVEHATIDFEGVTTNASVAIVTPSTTDGVTRAVKTLLDEALERGLIEPLIAPPVIATPVATGPTTFPELMKFITVNNKKLTKESVDEALKAQGLASIALLAARTDLIPQVHAALVKLL